jgi:hypothetical protein
MDASDSAEHEDGAVEHAERPLHLDGEVHVPGVSMMLMWVPDPRSGSRADWLVMPALALEVHRVGVHLRATPVLALHVVDRVDPLGVIEDALGQGVFPPSRCGH